MRKLIRSYWIILLLVLSSLGAVDVYAQKIISLKALQDSIKALKESIDKIRNLKGEYKKAQSDLAKLKELFRTHGGAITPVAKDNKKLNALALRQAAYEFAYFKGRSKIPEPDHIALMENFPPGKKEPFKNKIERYKIDLHNVAVVLNIDSIKSSSNLLSGQRSLVDSPPLIEHSYSPLAEHLVAQLNSKYRTDVFKSPALINIPYRNYAGGKVDDWGATRYKMVIILKLTPLYYIDNHSYGQKATFRIKMNVSKAFELVNTKKKGVTRVTLLENFRLGTYEFEFQPDSPIGQMNVREFYHLYRLPAVEKIVADLSLIIDDNLSKFTYACEHYK